MLCAYPTETSEVIKMVCKINNSRLGEEMDLYKAVEFLDDYTIIYECFHAMAFGCQALETGHCDHGESCMDI